jgi:hypothetical protein
MPASEGCLGTVPFCGTLYRASTHGDSLAARRLTASIRPHPSVSTSSTLSNRSRSMSSR